jgi:tetratricopeptide (TPR) repeat protein
MTVTMIRPNEQTIDTMRRASEQARGGDSAAALATVVAALARGRDLPILHALAGTLACRSGDLAAGVTHLGRALAAMPDDLATRVNLTQALVEIGRTDEAWALVPPDQATRDPSVRLWRLRGHLQQARGDLAGAVDSYERVVAALPDDFESWNNLGNARGRLGDKAAARTALDRAASLRPDLLSIRLNQAAAIAESAGETDALAYYEACVRDFPDDPRALGELGSLLGRLHRDDQARVLLMRAVALAPDDALLAVRLGEVCVATFDTAGGEAQFKRALTIDPRDAEANLQLAILYEQNNRVADLAALIRSAEAAAIEPGPLDFLRALGLRREKRFAEALGAMQAVPETIEPGRRAQLIGQCLDRLGDSEKAFDAFTEMNRLNALDPTDPRARAIVFRAGLRRAIETVTPAWAAHWTPSPPVPSDQPGPVFLVGFPRSGTTLLDTLLMGHPDISVMEELPPLRIAEDTIGDLSRLPSLYPAAVASARARYFEEVRARSDWRPGKLLVDKLPMNMNKVPLIHRLFPDARFILALRHPCDVVLSCFIATFKLNNAMANFLDIGAAAETYDLSFRYWQACRELLPIRVETVRYEDVVADRQATLRPVFDYLGLDWHDEVLDHEKTAAARSSIRTASYAQVTEPIYARAVGRWARYRAALEPVLPTLAPWAERFGYTI